jgi:hypothetical protein
MIHVERKNTAGKGPHVQILASEGVYRAICVAIEVAFDDPESTPPEYAAAAAELWPLTLRNACEQCSAAEATVYAIDPIPGGWGGRYCEPCQQKLGFRIVDRLGAPA